MTATVHDLAERRVIRDSAGWVIRIKATCTCGKTMSSKPGYEYSLLNRFFKHVDTSNKEN